MKYIFYDTETTGINPEFNQILQFAALEADEDLNELNLINIKCRPVHYIVPSPTAMVVTKVRPSELLSRKYSHLEMVYEMRNWILQRTPSLLIGHNSIKFDENFVRHSLYKTLYPVYLTNT
jgi:exodeoxyribonuclease-1